MKVFLGIMVALVMTFTGMACSKDNNNQQGAAAPQQEQAQPSGQQQAAQPAAPENQQSAAQQGQTAQQQGEQAQQQPEQQGQVAQQGQNGQTEEISGTVVKTDEGIALFSDQGNYMVEGKDLSEMIGKNVKVTGTVQENQGQKVITVSSVSVVE